LSSEAAGATAASYAFRQLDAPADATAGAGIADVVSAAIAEADQIRAQARAAGEAEGRAEGLAAVRSELRPAFAALREAVAAVAELRAGLTARLERDAAEVALLLAEQIVAAAIDIRPERVIDVARHALRHLSDRRSVTLVVNPADLEILSDGVEALRSELGGIEQLAVQSDRRIGRGSAVARTELGEIDLGIAAQVSRAREIVAEVLSADVS
jgi:flagellar assembly protein FliH